jgi:hypothetical protein
MEGTSDTNPDAGRHGRVSAETVFFIVPLVTGPARECCESS